MHPNACYTRNGINAWSVFFLFREIIAEWAQNDYNVLGKNQTFGNKSKIERSVQAQYIGMISECKKQCDKIDEEPCDEKGLRDRER